MFERGSEAGKGKIQQLLEEEKHAHILYEYKDNACYLQQCLNYTLDGISLGEHVILIENTRNHLFLSDELSARLTEEEMKQVHYVNSIIFYLSSGSYNPSAIKAHFDKMVKPYIENNVPFRSWAHVEWSSMGGPSYLIEEHEKKIDQAVNEIQFTLVCAYDQNRMPDHLHAALVKTHPYILLDDDLTVSEAYHPCTKAKNMSD